MTLSSARIAVFPNFHQELSDVDWMLPCRLTFSPDTARCRTHHRYHTLLNACSRLGDKRIPNTFIRLEVIVPSAFVFFFFWFYCWAEVFARMILFMIKRLTGLKVAYRSWISSRADAQRADAERAVILSRCYRTPHSLWLHSPYWCFRGIWNSWSLL